MQLQYGRNSYSRSYSRKGTSQNGVGEDQSNKRIKDANEGQRCGEFP